ncbi:MAG: sulfite exporter TauE/SafE family protein [Acidimicrobiia bacterium]
MPVVISYLSSAAEAGRSGLLAVLPDSVPMSLLVLVGAGVLVAGAVAGLSGFGFNLVSVPMLILVLEPRAGIIVSLLSGVAVTAAMLSSPALRMQIDRPTFSLLARASVVGVPIGLVLFARAPDGVLSAMIGGITLLYAIAVLTSAFEPKSPSRTVGVIAGIASGALAASTGLSGPPAVLLAHYRRLAAESFRATLTAYFFVISGISVTLLFATGLAPTGTMFLAAALAPLALAGMGLGRALFHAVSERLFARLVVLALLVMGLLNLGRLFL